PLRIDFLSAYTTIDVASIVVTAGESALFAGTDRETLSTIRVGGDAELLLHPEWLRVRITGIDPQLYLPPLPAPKACAPLLVTLKLRVSSAASGD
ncbi:MAG: hypothetical protein M3Y80_11430, partial [Verrucomicrobiota bacterium]|nr:hypothetical protein [Verrucomicrobiota bacterium]